MSDIEATPPVTDLDSVLGNEPAPVVAKTKSEIPLYEYVLEPGYETRSSVGGQSGPGRPSWNPMDASEAMRLMTQNHDTMGGRKALDALVELKCGSVLVRRCRKRVKIKGATAARAAEAKGPTRE